MAVFDSLNQLLLPRRSSGESTEQKLAHDAVDRFILGSARVKLADDISNLAMHQAHDYFSDEDELDEEKKKLEIEMMKRKLGYYMDDDKYEKQMNSDRPFLAKSLLVANTGRRYLERGKSLIDLLIGDTAHDGFVSRLARRK